MPFTALSGTGEGHGKSHAKSWRCIPSISCLVSSLKMWIRASNLFPARSSPVTGGDLRIRNFQNCFLVDATSKGCSTIIG